MNEKSHDSTPVSAAVAAASSGSGVSRRRLMRAGLGAAPVLAALKSNSVLAGGHSCVRPSSFSSLAAAHMKISQGRTIQQDFQCNSHGYWKNQDRGLPREFKTQTRFLSSTTGFNANPGKAYSSKNLQQVLDMGGNANNAALARHVLAAYLSAVSISDHSSLVWLTRRQCRDIWNGQGVWSPFAGTTWTLAQTMAYFEKIYGPEFV